MPTLSKLAAPKHLPVRYAVTFLTMYTVITLLGRTGKIDTFIWGFAGFISYFPASILTETANAYSYWDRSNIPDPYFWGPVLTDVPIGVIWWFGIGCAVRAIRKRPK